MGTAERINGALQGRAQYGIGEYHLPACASQGLDQLDVQVSPRGTCTTKVRPLQAGAVVEAHHRGVDTDVGVTHTGVFVALDENGASLARLHHHVHVVVAVVVGGSVVVGHPWSDIRGLVHVRDGLHHGRLTCRQGGCCEREAHELQEVTAPCRGRGELFVAKHLVNGLVLGELLTLKRLERLRLVKVIESGPVAFGVRHVYRINRVLGLGISSGTWSIPSPRVP